MTTSGSSNNQPFDRRPEKAALEQEIKASRRAVLVVNTRSRRGARSYSEAKRRLAEAGFTLDAAYPVRHAERLPEIVREAVAQGHKFIIIGGGDCRIGYRPLCSRQCCIRALASRRQGHGKPTTLNVGQ